MSLTLAVPCFLQVFLSKVLWTTLQQFSMRASCTASSWRQGALCETLIPRMTSHSCGSAPRKMKSWLHQIKTTSWLSSRTQLNDYADLEWGFFPFAQLFFFNLMVKNRALVLILLCHFNNVWKNKSRCFCCLQTEKAALFFFCITSRFEDELVN